MSEQWKNVYDERQYALMESQLHQYEQSAIDLGSLISSLESLLQCLQAASEEWKNKFLAEWGVLEDVNAHALDQVEQGVAAYVGTILSQQDNRRLIAEATEELRRLLAERNC